MEGRERRRRTKSSVLLPDAPAIFADERSQCPLPYRPPDPQYYSPHPSTKYTRKFADIKNSSILKETCNSAAFHAEHRRKILYRRAPVPGWQADPLLASPEPIHCKACPTRDSISFYTLDDTVALRNPLPLPMNTPDQQKSNKPSAVPPQPRRNCTGGGLLDEERGMMAIHNSRVVRRFWLSAAVCLVVVVFTLLAVLAASQGREEH